MEAKKVNATVHVNGNINDDDDDDDIVVLDSLEVNYLFCAPLSTAIGTTTSTSDLISNGRVVVPHALSSGSPSASPSADPSAVPSAAPSVSPSADPGSGPSSRPSVVLV